MEPVQIGIIIILIAGLIAFFGFALMDFYFLSKELHRPLQWGKQIVCTEGMYITFKKDYFDCTKGKEYKVISIDSTFNGGIIKDDKDNIFSVGFKKQLVKVDFKF